MSRSNDEIRVHKKKHFLDNFANSELSLHFPNALYNVYKTPPIILLLDLERAW